MEPTQATLAILLEEKAQAEERAAGASCAADKLRTEMELVRRRAEEVVRASEQESEALRANAAEVTAARILAKIDSKYPQVATAAACAEPSGGAAVGADVDGANKTFGGECTGDVVAEICRRFEITYRAAQTAGVNAIQVETELSRVRGEAEVALHQQRDAASALVADAQRAARQTSAAAAERVAEREVALQKARADVSRLQEELGLVQATEAVNRVAVEENKAQVSAKIAQLEDDLREAVVEHQRSRHRAELEIEQLRATLESREEAQRAASAEEATREKLAAAAAEAETEVAAKLRRQVEHSKHELRVAKQAFTDATKEAESLRKELARTVETTATSKTQQNLAETRAAEMEEELKEAQREHVLFREEAEERLRKLKSSFEEENLRNGAQVRDCCVSQTERRLHTRRSPTRSILSLKAAQEAPVLLEDHLGSFASGTR